MSTGVSTNDGIFGAFPYEVVITPATVAGLVVAIAQYLLSIATSPMAQVSVQSIVVTLINAINWIGFLVAVLAIVVSGARSDVLAVGVILTYVAGLLATLLQSLYVPGPLQLSTGVFLAPLSLVIAVVGVGIGVNWIGVDVSLLD